MASAAALAIAIAGAFFLIFSLLLIVSGAWSVGLSLSILAFLMVFLGTLWFLLSSNPFLMLNAGRRASPHLNQQSGRYGYQNQIRGLNGMGNLGLGGVYGNQFGTRGSGMGAGANRISISRNSGQNVLLSIIIGIIFIIAGSWIIGIIVIIVSARLLVLPPATKPGMRPASTSFSVIDGEPDGFE